MDLRSLIARTPALGVAGGKPDDPNAAFDAGIDRDIGKINLALLPLLVTALGAATYGGWGSAFGAVLLWCISVLTVGATLGFLFGIPKTASAPAKSRQKDDAAAAGAGAVEADALASNGRANTNLEEVSDWLTKIVVGLTLVHWATIRNDVIAISAHMAASMRTTPTGADQSFAAALIVGFFTLGFLFGYLYTRMFLQGAFVRADQSMQIQKRFNDVVKKEMREDLSEAKDDAGETAAALPSAEQIQSAERVRQVAPADNPQAVLAPLRALAAEYERVRASMPPSAERTRAMTQVVRRMTTLALAAAPHLAEFANSASSGERLVAVAILKVSFDPRYTEWLARRLVEYPPFIGFHAAGALLVGVRKLAGDEKAKLQRLVQAAQDELKSKQMADEGRDRLIEEILKA